MNYCCAMNSPPTPISPHHTDSSSKNNIFQTSGHYWVGRKIIWVRKSQHEIEQSEVA